MEPQQQATPAAQPGWITLDAVLAAAWRRKWLVAACVVVFAGLAAAAAFTMTPMYRAQVVVIPVKADDGRAALSSMVGQLGGLASLAGVSLGGGGNKDEYIRFLRSSDFTARFIEDEKLLPVLFAKRWDAERGQWNVEDPADVPTVADGVRLFDDGMRNVSEEKVSGIVTLTLVWSDREQVAKWANLLIERANRDLRKRAIAEAQASTDYLNAELAKTSVLELRQAIYRLLENQIKTVMLANVRDQYAFRVIDPASAPDPDDTVRPKRLAMILLGMVFGGGVALMIVLWGLRRQRLQRAEDTGAA
jgi:uncharacterized protein involved in exopolysaccharide biosynthesis